jgi:hypothetical protein
MVMGGKHRIKHTSGEREKAVVGQPASGEVAAIPLKCQFPSENNDAAYEIHHPKRDVSLLLHLLLLLL